MNNNTRKIVTTAILTALVIILQIFGASIKFGPFSVSLVLVPIVIGAATSGVASGAFLGFVFGLMVLLTGDAMAFLAINWWGTIATVLLKGTLAGFLSGVTFEALKNKNKTFAVVAAAAVCPIVNTGVFLLGCFLFFFETIKQWGTAAGFEGDTVRYMIFGLVGINFVFEFLVDMVLSPVVVRLLDIYKKIRA